MREFLQFVGEWLDLDLFVIGGTQVRLSTLLTVVIVLIVTLWVVRVLRMLVERTLTKRGTRPGDIGTISGLLRYVVLVMGFGIAIDTAGIDLTALFAAGALFAVGLGFAMQSIAQNFVAGVILLGERSIKPGDILQVEGKFVKVIDIGIRASVARTRDGEDLVIPNAVLIQTTVTNFTLKDSAYRIRVPVGVTYGSDMALVKATLTAVAEKISSVWSVPGHDPLIVMTEFGNHAVNWEVRIWMNDPWKALPATSALYEEIWWAFQKKDIVIAFPQLDVHFDPAIMDGVARATEQAA